ncbi:MAG: HIT family protein [Saprospiraceae bacterium]
MSSIFTKIVNGDIPCHKIAETDKYLAFLDIMPVGEGHVLVIPKEEIDYFFDLEDDLMTGLMLFAKEIAIGLKKTIECNRVGVVVAGLEVPHAHVHLIPFSKIEDIDFDKRMPTDHVALAKTAEQIRTNL